MSGCMLDIEALIADIERIQRQAKTLNIDLHNDFSLTTDALCRAFLWIARNCGWEKCFAKVPFSIRDDCMSQAVMYMLKYGIPNYSAEKCGRHFIPYFRRIAHSAYYRVIQNFNRNKERELAVKNHIIETHGYMTTTTEERMNEDR